MLLNCHSYYSLRFGTIPLAQLVNAAKDLKITALALTDIHTFYGVYDFIRLCQQVGIHPLIGAEFRVDQQLQYIGIAKSQAGFTEMNEYITHHNKTKQPFPKKAPAFEDVFVIYPLENCPPTLADHEYIGVKLNQRNVLYQEHWKQRIHKMVILHPVTLLQPEDYELHRILQAIDQNTLLSKLDPNTCAAPNEMLVAEEELYRHFESFPELIANTQKIVTEANFAFTFKKSRNKRCFTDSKASDLQLLTSLAQEGLTRIYGGEHEQAKQRLQKELDVIEKLSFASYFLIIWDIITYSTQRGFMHIGRGSGANSLVGYCIGITNVCPLELDLYFERFLNVNRKSPPDFDIDWSWTDRDAIIDYIFETYGAEHVAFCGAMSTFKKRSIVREIGKVFGLAKEELDQLNNRYNPSNDNNSIVQLIHQYGQKLEGFPNQRTMHACGMIISEEPITHFTALDYPPKGYAVAQFDMHIAEDIGFEKFDILSQRGIGHINETVELIEQNQQITLDIRDISLSKNEAKSNTYLQAGNTIGCFYIESPAMRGLLRKLKCNDYKTLVAASSIIRPGVAQSGMMQEYIFRHNNPHQFDYFHEVFQDQLGETYGIMVYQEDVIKIALHYGGLPAEDGDILRRAMSGKNRSKEGLQAVRERFLTLCEAKGHPQAQSEEIYRQIESFAGYSFCKAHSASYAIESYQSLYLKAHYPLEFIVAVINNQGGFYRTEVYVHEAKMSGARVFPPCINRSNQGATLRKRDIFLGFQLVKNLNTALIETIVTERQQQGNYTSLADFIQRVNIPLDALETLIFIGAFQFTGLQKNELLIQAKLLYNKNKSNPTWQLLQEPIKTFTFPQMKRTKVEDAFDELEYLGFPVTSSPFDLLQTKFRGEITTKDFLYHKDKTTRLVGYLIALKPIQIKSGVMYFGTWIDSNGDYFDSVHFPHSLQQYPFQGSGCYLLLGDIQIEYDVPTLHMLKMAKLPYRADPRYVNS
ncbi:DNA polymerase III subunit alpha [Myroides fluvii]|uniref:DNA polymerase III subunit alpha n=1 Tax=Myroides fluvii TaxID=2572594 RepID=UPI00131D3C5B|nr:DNA polymerase III subunit alpha [Myroides fluvii]